MKHQKHCRAPIGFVCSCLPDVIDITVKTEEFTPNDGLVTRGLETNEEAQEIIEQMQKKIKEANTPDTEWEKELHNRVGEIIGEASMCWSETPKGVFESAQASRLVDELLSLITSRDTYWKERVRKWIDENEYCSMCCSTKKFCNKWGESASAIDTKDLLQALDNLK